MTSEQQGYPGPGQPPAASGATQTAAAPAGSLEQQLAALHADNSRLHAELATLRERSDAAAAARSAVIRGGARVLVPLLDRNGVVRSFSKMLQTTSSFAGPREQWPTRDQVLDDARRFGESCVRFFVRRRLFVLLFSLVATAIPIIQVYLVVQQNEIIENQNEFFRIQVYDVVSRSMTEGNRNARLMTGALLANAEPEFLADVVEETFDPDLAGVWRDEGEGASVRRLQDAAFRGYLVHAVRRSVEQQLASGADADELHPRTRSMIARVIEDAADRVPQVLTLGADGQRRGDELDEQVDNYLAQVGTVLQTYGRLSRSTDDSEAFVADVRRLLQRTVRMKIDGNRFEVAYRVALEGFVLDVGAGGKLGDPATPPSTDDGERNAARSAGVAALREALGADALDWAALESQGTAP
ncbi:MAG: hypothetical protein AAF721_35625 [Myxococcota bacterium]